MGDYGNAVRIWDVIYYQTLIENRINIPSLEKFDLYKEVTEGVLMHSAGVKKEQSDVFLFNVTSASASFKEKYSDIITEYEVESVISPFREKKTGVSINAHRTWELIPDVFYTPELEEFAIYSVESEGVLRENPGLKHTHETLFYDVTSANDEFKSKHKDHIVEVQVKKVIPIQKAGKPKNK